MDKMRVEFIVAAKPLLPEDEYVQSVVGILTPPSIMHPIKRRKYWKNYNARIHVVMAEYARELLSEINTANTTLSSKQS